MADASRQHDGLVVAAHLARNKLLKSAKITCEVWPSKLIVECRSPDRSFQHDLQCRGDALRFAVGAACARIGMSFLRISFPWLSKVGNIQVGNRETAEPGPRLCAPAGGALVTYFPSHTGGGARIR